MLYRFVKKYKYISAHFISISTIASAFDCEAVVIFSFSIPLRFPRQQSIPCAPHILLSRIDFPFFFFQRKTYSTMDYECPPFPQFLTPSSPSSVITRTSNLASPLSPDKLPTNDPTLIILAMENDRRPHIRYSVHGLKVTSRRGVRVNNTTSVGGVCAGED